VDAAGLAADVAATVLPGVPGGAGTAIKAVRAADKAKDAYKTVKRTEKAAETVRKAEKVVEASKAAGKETKVVTSRAARRESMRQQGIPTSQQPVKQSKNASGRSYEYEVPKKGGGKETKSVQQQTMDRSHEGEPHWEAGSVKTDRDTGEIQYNNYGRPKLKNDKSKVDYNE
jgi:hypothetical protein